MKASYQKHILNFKRPSGTSRGVMTQKETWFLILETEDSIGIGECGILRSLSFDDRSDYEDRLMWVCENIELGPDKLWEKLREFPSIQFGVEMAFRSLHAQTSFLLFPSEFTEGKAAIPINGLVWMGEEAFMKEQIVQKIEQGFRCIKLKIGAIDFEKELDLLRYIRKEFPSEEMEIRVDANGAFSPSEAMEKLKRLSELELHSIEQPVKQRQWEVMASLCEKTPIPIALDEELIGITSVTKKRELLQTIKPQYLIFKPSLIGGFRGTTEWIELADEQGTGWWITSALESNVGLNAIAQYTFEQNNPMPQGLGTGGLYTNNFDSPLEVKKGELWYRPQIDWNFNL
ncbi:o-succinylbenzoate synthase [Salinimicrobium catena]|uniref:O-succinylbenzoate synthase n=1 Tax=Salinimicrobium catena TaxID=390640 RepID=A0A1H5L5M1_9FLAO|nr:o-succinylbenzoate synthase [Salinimicrobium catena]SDL05965.1 o-succinylbenzoate synthase [Salinimicrobium catena]SEE72303.1 o-succinylbenzoate synthase [Salinimicrobium catena]